MTVEIVYDARSLNSLLDPLHRVYLLAGEDDRQKDEAIEAIKGAAIDASFADFDLEVLDAESTPVEAVFASAGMVPFGSPRRMVVLRGAEIYRRRDRQQDAARLAEGIGALGSLTTLVVKAAEEEEAGKSKTALTAKIDAAAKSAGMLVRFRSLTPEGLRDALQARARAAGKALDEDAADWLSQASHGERRALENELEKVICFAADRNRITVADVEAVCSYDAEDVLFKLVDAVGARNADRALYLLGEALRYDTKPQAVAGRLLALLARQLRLLWQANELALRRIGPGSLRGLPSEIASDLPAEGSIVSMAWKASDLFRQARTWNRQTLADAFDLLVRCDLANKGGEEGSADVVTNLQVLIANLCRK